jgi:SAM-dependent methyltransferase
MKYRMDRRIKRLQHKAERVYNGYVLNRTDKDVNDAEEDRLWLDQFANGNGFDICCGDFLIGGEDQAAGIDGDARWVGVDKICEGDELAFQKHEELDFVVTNYLEGMPYPLKALNEWWRVLKPEGVLAMICRDANKYSSKYPQGALGNGSRQNTYTAVTLSHYLYRAGFTNVKIEETDGLTLRAYAEKGVRAA